MVHVVQVQTTDQLYLKLFYHVIHRYRVLFPRAWFNVEHLKHTGVPGYMTLTLHVIHVCPHVPGVYPGTL